MTYKEFQELAHKEVLQHSEPLTEEGKRRTQLATSGLQVTFLQVKNTDTESTLKNTTNEVEEIPKVLP